MPRTIDVDFKLTSMTRRAVPGRLRGKLGPDDFAQDSWVRMLGDHDPFAGRQVGEVRSFLKKVIVSVRNDHVRYFGRGKRDASRERPLKGACEGVAADLSTPSRRVSRKESQQLVRAALASLPENQRRAVQLHHMDGRSLKDTAEEMGITPTAVAGLVFRGVKTLASRLRELKDV